MSPPQNDNPSLSFENISQLAKSHAEQINPTDRGHPASLSEQEMRGILAETGWAEKDVSDALCITWHESHWQPDAINENTDGSEDLGIFQINSWWATAAVSADFPAGKLDRAQVFDPHYNAIYALAILKYGGLGWHSWSTAPICGLSAHQDNEEHPQ